MQHIVIVMSVAATSGVEHTPVSDTHSADGRTPPSSTLPHAHRPQRRPAGSQHPPHLVLALVDDWGWRDGPQSLRPGNGLITPTMDALAACGVAFNRAYAFRYCSPTRSAVLSGRLPIHVNQINLANYERGGGIPREMNTLADKLSVSGHASKQSSKRACTWCHDSYTSTRSKRSHSPGY